MIEILYRECRFQTAFEMFKEIKPDITKSQLFNILGGLTNSLYIYEIEKVKFYILSGGTERLRLDKFFKYYEIEHDELMIEEFLSKKKDFKKNFYVLPIMTTMMSKESFIEEDKNFLGCSFSLIKDYSKDENKIFFDSVVTTTHRMDWINTNELIKLNKFRSNLIGNYYVYKIEKEKIKQNKYIRNYCMLDLKSLVIKNATNFLYGTGDSKKFNSVNGSDFYDYLIRHFRKLENVLNNKSDYKSYSQLIKYYKIQIIYLRNLLIAGTDTFYRGEFVDTINDLDFKHDKFDKKLYIDDWNKCAKIWRKIGRLLMNMYDNLQEEKVNKLINYFITLRDIEIKSMTLLLENLQDI